MATFLSVQEDDEIVWLVVEPKQSGFYAKRDERQKSFGVSHMDVLRLCASVEGRMDDARDFDLTPIWEDTDVRTINQAVDALGKAAQVRLTITADSQARRLWDSTLNLNDLRSSQPIWKNAMLDLLQTWWRISADTAGGLPAAFP